MASKYFRYVIVHPNGTPESLMIPKAFSVSDVEAKYRHSLVFIHVRPGDLIYGRFGLSLNHEIPGPCWALYEDGEYVWHGPKAPETEAEACAFWRVAHPEKLTEEVLKRKGVLNAHAVRRNTD